MYLTIEGLLAYRAMMHIILGVVFGLGAVLALYEKRVKGKNGVFTAMFWLLFVSACYMLLMAYVSFNDVCQDANVRQVTLLLWNIVTSLLLGCFVLLGIRLYAER